MTGSWCSRGYIDSCYAQSAYLMTLELWIKPIIVIIINYVRLKNERIKYNYVKTSWVCNYDNNNDIFIKLARVVLYNLLFLILMSKKQSYEC